MEAHPQTLSHSDIIWIISGSGESIVVMMILELEEHLKGGSNFLDKFTMAFFFCVCMCMVHLWPSEK